MLLHHQYDHADRRHYARYGCDRCRTECDTQTSLIEASTGDRVLSLPVGWTRPHHCRHLCGSCSLLEVLAVALIL